MTSAKKTILVVEDDAAIGTSLCLLLQEAGFLATLYRSPEPLLDNNYAMPHLFIVDRQLAGVDGLDLCRHLKKEVGSSTVPLILFSAAPHIAQLAAEAGADAFEEKPFQWSSLLQKITGLLK